jgi:plasmid maintenance system killer protein
LELAFETKSIRTICESHLRAKDEFGDRVADVLKRRLADLDAATSVKDLVASPPYSVDGANCGHMAIDLCDEYLMVFCPNHRKNPTTASGELDWGRVTRIKIIRVGRDHVR